MENAERAAAQRETVIKEAVSLFKTLVSSSEDAAWKPVALPSVAGAAPDGGAAALDDRISLSKGSSTVGRPASLDGKAASDARGPSSKDGAGEAASTPLGFQLLGLDKASRVTVHRRANPQRRGPDVLRATLDVPFEGDQPDLSSFRNSLTTPDARPMWDPLAERSELIEMPDSVTRISKTNFRLGWPASPRDAVTVSRLIEDDRNLVDITTSLRASPDAPAYLRPSPPYVRSHVHLFAWCIQLPSRSSSKSKTIRVTAYWSWNLKGAWMGLPAGGLGNQLQLLVRRLVKHVREQSFRIPALRHFGPGIDIEHATFDASRDTLALDYSVVDAGTEAGPAVDLDMAAAEGWDVTVKLRGHGEGAVAEWTPRLQRSKGSTRLRLSISHGRPSSSADIARASLKIQRIAASSEFRLNGEVKEIDLVDAPAATNSNASGVLNEAASISDISIASSGSVGSISNAVAVPQDTSRTPNASHVIDSLIRRNYIYFTSLLQEPEAKWRDVSDSRGVTVTKLDSIDPTLVVYRAEATFVGVGVWDLFATINTPGARQQWDKTLEDSHLLSDVSDLSSLWWDRTKATWPVSARDSVTVQTSYKSTSSVHIFGFSTDDRKIFPEIPPPAPTTIRTQVDLRGWSVESLSPTTVHVTLLEQSDPKGWTSKTAVPASMTASVAGVGEYAIKFGGPPVVTRLLGAKAKSSKYEHDKAEYRFEYALTHPDASERISDLPNVECELRCDVETWSPNLDLVIDPPPINVSCLRRHKLGQGAGGLWLTIEHAPASLEDDLARVIVRKGHISSQKGVVLVNGATIKVDQDELDDSAMQFTKKRTRPLRVPLDLTSPSYLATANKAKPSDETATVSDVGSATPSRSATASERPASPARSAASIEAPAVAHRSPSDGMSGPLDGLFLLRRIYAERSPDPAVTPAGWALVSERGGLHIRRKLMQSISASVFVQRADKVVQGLTAEDLLHAIASTDARRLCDPTIETIQRLESYGHGAGTYFMTTKPSFPFRGRAFHVAHLVARTAPRESAQASITKPIAYFHAAASVPESTVTFPSSRLNPTGLPVGKVLIDGWILETLDPYASSTHQIPSTRCTHIMAIDYAGSLPASVNTSWNAALPRTINALEALLKRQGTVPFSVKPPPCMLVLGDGRDESADTVWEAEDPGMRKVLLKSDFDWGKHRYSALALLRPAADALHADAISEASTERGLAQTAAVTSLPPSLKGSPQIDQSDRSSRMRTESSITRATSISSLSSAVSEAKRAASARRDPIRAEVFFEVEVDLKHFPHGYDVRCGASFAPSSEPASSQQKSGQLVDLSKSPRADDPITLRTVIYDLPPSALLAATLDARERPRRHLIRVVLADDQAGSKVKKRLSNDKATLSFTLEPRASGKPDLRDSTEPPRSQNSTPPIGLYTVDGQQVSVVHVNQTSAMLQNEDREADKVVILQKNDASNASYVPALLRQVLAADLSLKNGPAASAASAATKGSSQLQSSATSRAPTPAAEQNAGTSHTPPSAATREHPVSSATTQIMSILNNYPLSRLGTATTSLTNSVAAGTTTHPTKESTSSDAGEQTQAGVSQITTNLAESLQTRTYTLGTLLLVAVIFFLLGSLVRGLQSPADFVLMPPASKSSDDSLTAELHRFLADLSPGSARVATRELKRLFEVKRLFFGWDLVIGLARR